MQGIGSADDDLEASPIESTGLLVVFKELECGRHAEERGGLVPVHGIEDFIQVRRSEQYKRCPHGKSIEHDHYLAIDVVEGQ